MAALLVLGVSGCGSESASGDSEAGEQAVEREQTRERADLPGGKLGEQVKHAMTDLVGRLGLPDDGTIRIISAETVTWRDSSMGCSLPDRGYLQVLTPGVLIVLGHGKQTYPYHGSRTGKPFLCEPPGRVQSPLRGHDDGT
jgi:hypothetical protein